MGRRGRRGSVGVAHRFGIGLHHAADCRRDLSDLDGRGHAARCAAPPRRARRRAGPGRLVARHRRILGPRGVGTNLLNPKVGVFYMAMLPQFIPAGSSHLLMGAVMAMVHNLEGVVWFTAIICTAGLARSWLNRDRVRRTMDAVTGAVLVGFGVDLAVGRR
ncbi:hypothetical protein GLP40_06240 [Nocardia sp. CT2-14]|uniref:LysE family translocator n=2 Tax=Nocardia aurantiaca TaxID=2675850 RepID=A0A6I3KP74_9NOCA|nr:hypothetical protein [Nocardia aurantiaca]